MGRNSRKLPQTHPMLVDHFASSMVRDLTGPAMNQQDRNCVFSLRKKSNKMNVEILNLHLPLGETVYAGLGGFPVAVSIHDMITFQDINRKDSVPFVRFQPPLAHGHHPVPGNAISTIRLQVLVRRRCKFGQFDEGLEVIQLLLGDRHFERGGVSLRCWRQSAEWA